MRKASPRPTPRAVVAVPPAMEARLRAAAALPDEHINTGDPDAPEVLDWSGAVRGRYYRPIKKLKSLRIDADVLAFFESGGPGYQTRINRTLRAAMLRELRRRERAKRNAA